MTSLFFRLLITLDCWINSILGGSFNETMSSRAYRMHIKPQPYWWWLAVVIDFLALILFGQLDHCQRSYEKELRDNGANHFWSQDQPPPSTSIGSQ